MRVVIDTGVLVSGLIKRKSTTGDLLLALRDGLFTVVYSTDMLVEIVDVLGRPEMRAKYHIEPEDTAALIDLLRLRGELVRPNHKITACRDSKDDKFLEAALSAGADCIISGDADLLVLKSFESIPILRPADFLAMHLP